MFLDNRVCCRFQRGGRRSAALNHLYAVTPHNVRKRHLIHAAGDCGSSEECPAVALLNMIYEKARKRDRRRRNLNHALDTYGIIDRRAEGLDRDEYPFACTVEGGLHGDVGADNEYVPTQDNYNQGRDLGEFLRQRMNYYTPSPFLVRVIP